MKVEAFKDLLKHYYDYQESIVQIQEDMDLLLYDMTGVKGISYDKIPLSFDPKLSEQIKLEYIERMAEKEAELDFTYAAIRMIEMKLSKLPKEDKKICLDILNRNITYEEAGKKIGYSKHGMWQSVKRKMEKIL